MKREYFEVLLEDIKVDVKGIAENVSLLNGRVENVKVELKNDIIMVNSQMNFVYTNLSNRIDKVDNKLSKRIDDVESGLSKRIDTVGSNLSKRIDASEANLSGKIDTAMDRIENHEVRLIKLEK